MKTALIIAACLILSYIIFIVGPAVTSFFNVYNRKRGTLLYERKGLKGTFYEPYLEDVRKGAEKLEKRLTKNVFITARDNIKLYGRYYGADPEKLAILVHGYNALPENNYYEIGNDLLDSGISILMPYSRAHYPSEGDHCTFGLLEQYDILSWIDYAVEELGAKKIVLYGMSMGCATIAFSSDKITSPAVRGMVLDCGLDSPLGQYYADCKARHLPARSLSFLVKIMGRLILKVDLTATVRDSLAKTTLPALFVHGTADTTVDCENTKRCFEICRCEKKLVISEGSGHTFSYADLKKKGNNEIFEYIKELFTR